MKKMLSLLMAMLMLVALVGQAVAANGFNETGLPIVDEPVTVSIAVTRHGNDAADSYNDKYVIKRATEATNVQVEWTEILSAAVAERVPIILASNELPDAFLGPLTDSQITQNSSMFLPLNDLITRYSPNVMNLYESSVPGWEKYLTYPDGNIYGLMGGYLLSVNDSISGVMFINQAWLEQLGMEIPTTLDELKVVLAAFRDNDLAGDGTQVIPMDICQTHVWNKFWDFAQCYGIPGYYDIQDSQIVGTVNTDTYRRFLTDCYEMCQDGLINVEGLTQTYEQFISNVGSMKVGAFWGYAPYTYITEAEDQAQYVPLSPILVDDLTPRVTASTNTSRRNNLVISKASDKAEIILRWWDYLSTDQVTSMEGREGPIGLNFTQGEDGLLYGRTATVEEAEQAGYGAYASNIGTSTWNATMGLTVCQPLCLTTLNFLPGTNGSVRRAAVDIMKPYFAEEAMVKAIVPAENQEEFDFATDGLISFIDSFLAESILNGVTDESWSAYLNQLSAYGYDFYLSWYQDYFDGTF